MLLRITVESWGDFLPALKHFVLLTKTLTYWRFTFQLMRKSWSSSSQPLWPSESQQSVLFWNGSNLLPISSLSYVIRMGIFLDKSFLFRFSILMGHICPGRNSLLVNFLAKLFGDGRGLSVSRGHKSGLGANKYCNALVFWNIFVSARYNISYKHMVSCQPLLP